MTVTKKVLLSVVVLLVAASGLVAAQHAVAGMRERRATARAASALAALPAPDGTTPCHPASGPSLLVCWSGPGQPAHVTASLARQRRHSGSRASSPPAGGTGPSASSAPSRPIARDARTRSTSVPRQTPSLHGAFVSGGYEWFVTNEIPGEPVDVRL
ncbi:hypothetical protein GCM10025868_41250 [Angustibacter aerolatus]|uniref:Uncharacterized protein n=1 Tax=Angustibacter aerolatus TaxID=1162965 RepID=A0ABQ6JKU1_9ACTN|nr:hypothetical protein GCM10025868_41250 [Angustibacter aerolatus]